MVDCYVCNTSNILLNCFDYAEGSSGLVVMGGDSCSKGRGFESQRHILDGHFFTFICCIDCNVCLKRRK